MGEKLGLKLKAWSEEQEKKEAERKATCITPQQKRDYKLEQIWGMATLIVIGFCALWAVGRMFTPQSCSEYSAGVKDTLGTSIDSKEEIEFAARGIQARPECF